MGNCKKRNVKRSFFSILLVSWLFTACDKNNDFVIFSIADDVQLGKQVSDEIAKDPTIKLLSKSSNPEVYNYLHHIRDGILNSGKIAYKEEFAWELNVIENDTVLNAFATPGGYIYIYTGLIKYLDHADDLAGVMGHEMAHADKRHTVRNLQKMYGVQILLSVALGQDPGVLAQIGGQIAGTLAGLQFSREYETEADASSVEYLAKTEYACNGAAMFFMKLDQEGGSRPPEFLSTHPSPENRIANINSKAAAIGCDTSLAPNAGYEGLKSSLP